MNILKQFGIQTNTKLYIETPELLAEKSFILKSENVATKNTLPFSENYCSKNIVCFLDGSCLNNGKKGAIAGYAAVFPDYPYYDISEPLKGKLQTNNRAEYTAFIRAADQVNIIDPTFKSTLEVYSDSELLINSITKWLPNWKRNGFIKKDGKSVLNQDLLNIIDNITKKRRVKWNHVRAHTGKTDFASVYNDKADRMAKEATTKFGKNNCSLNTLVTIRHND